MVYEASFDLPDGYQVQVMVLQDFPGGQRKRGLRMNVFRSRIWIGHVSEPEAMVHRSQEHQEKHIAIDACHSMLLLGARQAIDSPAALAALESKVHAHFLGTAQAM